MQKRWRRRPAMLVATALMTMAMAAPMAADDGSDQAGTQADQQATAQSSDVSVAGNAADPQAADGSTDASDASAQPDASAHDDNPSSRVDASALSARWASNGRLVDATGASPVAALRCRRLASNGPRTSLHRLASIGGWHPDAACLPGRHGHPRRLAHLAPDRLDGRLGHHPCVARHAAAGPACPGACAVVGAGRALLPGRGARRAPPVPARGAFLQPERAAARGRLLPGHAHRPHPRLRRRTPASACSSTADRRPSSWPSTSASSPSRAPPR